MLQVRLLGQYEICVDGQPVIISSRPAQSLLAYLLLTLAYPGVKFVADVLLGR